MKKIIILSTAIIAGLLTAAFAENGLWWPAIGCIGWNIFLLIVNWNNFALMATIKKKPGAATPGKRGKTVCQTTILNLDDSTVTVKTQSKAWTPVGKALTPIHFVE